MKKFIKRYWNLEKSENQKLGICGGCILHQNLFWYFDSFSGNLDAETKYNICKDVKYNCVHKEEEINPANFTLLLKPSLQLLYTPEITIRKWLIPSLEIKYM